MKQSGISSFFKKKPSEPEGVTLISFKPNVNSPTPVSSKRKAPDYKDKLPSPKRAALEYEANRQRCFQPSWKTKFKWLVLKDGRMYCSVCCQFKNLYKFKNSVFIAGSDRFRIDPIQNHDKSPDHLQCVGALAAREKPKETPLAIMQRRLERKQLTHFQSFIRSAFLLAKWNWSLNSFGELVQLQIMNGAHIMAQYQNIAGAKSFIESIAYAQRQNTVSCLQQS